MNLYHKIDNNEVYFIAEMSANHGGELSNALEIVRQVADAGADCLKIQTYTADSLTIDCNNEYFQIHGGLWDGYKLYDLYVDASTPYEWTKPIMEECQRCGIDFLSTPFDRNAIDFLENCGVEFYKIASFELVDIPLIKKAASTGKPLIISCGMGTPEEIQEALDAAKSEGTGQVVLLKCCSAYPTDYETMHLRTITDMKERFGVPVGLSDHSIGTTADIAAAALGAQVIEKHFCISRQDNTVDSAFSLSKDEFAQMVQAVRNTEKALGSYSPSGGVSYGPSAEEAQSYSLRRSIYAVKDIAAGEPFTRENIRCIRPSGGLHPRYYEELIGGKRAGRAIPFGTPLHMDDIQQ